MDKPTIYFIIFIILFGGVFAYFYFNYDFISKKPEYTNISISAEFNNEKKPTGYVIESIEGTLTGNTSQSYEKLVLERNQIIKIYNKNFEDQNYYQNLQTINLSKPTMRITLQLDEPEPINYEILNETPIRLFLESRDARNIDFCLDWSLAYIYVKTNYTKIKTEKEFETWNQCYDGNFTLQDSNETITVDYKKFMTPTENDYIKILLISRDNNLNQTKIIKLL